MHNSDVRCVNCGSSSNTGLCNACVVVVSFK